MGKLTTHILDTTLGTPAEMVSINLYRRVGSNSEHIMSTQTNKDGRCDEPLLSEDNFQEGAMRLNFQLIAIMKLKNQLPFSKRRSHSFYISNKDENYHVPY